MHVRGERSAGDGGRRASSAESLSARGLGALADSVCRFPVAYVVGFLLLAAGSVLYTWQQLRFNSSRNDLVDAQKRYHRQFLQFRQEFPNEDDLVAVVESDDLEKNRQFIERLAARVEAETNLFTDVFYKGDLKLMGPKALLFLPSDTLRELAGALTDFQPFVQQFAQATNLYGLFRLINRQFVAAGRTANTNTQSLLKALPALERILAQARLSLHRGGAPPSPGLNALFNAGPEAEQRMYLTFDRGRLYLLTARPRSEEVNTAATTRLRELVNRTRHEVPGVNAGLTGEYVLEMDEMAQSKKDTTVATLVSLFLVALIFIYGYHETWRPLKATVCLVIGLILTMAFTTLAIGHLNILTITFVPMLIGLAIDFGVHLVTRFEEELSRGCAARAAMRTAMVFTGKGISTGCFTTAAAFFAMSFTGFKGIQEMGIISGGGLLVCLVPMMTLLPVLLLWKGAGDSPPPTLADHRARIERWWLDRPVWVLLVTLGCTALACAPLRRVYFDYNLLHLQSKGLSAVVFEQKLIQSSSKSVLFGAVVADSLAEALALEQVVEKLPAVASVNSIARVLAEPPDPKLGLIRDIKHLAQAIQFPEMDWEPVGLSDFNYALTVFRSFLGLALNAAGQANETELVGQLRHLRQTVMELQSDLSRCPWEQASARLGAFQRALFRDLRQTFEALQRQDDQGGLREADLPPAIRNRFLGRTGKFLLQVYPKHDVWERKNQEQFVRELRAAVDPHDTGQTPVTGTPVQLFEYTTLLKRSYEEAATYSLAAIALLTLIHFRSLICVALALVPVGIGTVWTVGLMGLCGVPFNPANIMMLPLVVGIGVTNGIHILNRFAEEQNPGILARSTGKAVIVSALTTVAGFGSLMLSRHQGIASLGFIMAVGTSACMVAALTALPAVIVLLQRAGWTIRTPWRKPSGDAGPGGATASNPG